MATITETVPITVDAEINDKVKPSARKALHLSGVLDQYDHFDVTPVIGREFPNASLKEWLEAPNADELLRDLAITSMFAESSISTETMLTGTSIAARRRLL